MRHARPNRPTNKPDVPAANPARRSAPLIRAIILRAALGVLVLVLGFLSVPGSQAQEPSEEARKVAGERFPVAASEGKPEGVIVGKAITTIAVQSGYNQTAGFVLEDFSAGRERVAVYINGNVPPLDTLVSVGGQLKSDMVPVNERRKERLFVATGWQPGLPSGTEIPQGTPSAVATAETSSQQEPGNTALLVALGVLLIGGVTLLLGLFQRSRRKPAEPLVNPLETGYGAAAFNTPSPGSSSPVGTTSFSSPTPASGRSSAPAVAPASSVGPGIIVDPVPEVEKTKRERISLADIEAMAEAEAAGSTEDDADVPSTALPAYLEVVNGGAEAPGVRKALRVRENNNVFDIARPSSGQENRANFIPIKSSLVSRNPDNQGKLIYDPLQNAYIVRNLADPEQRKNPIKVGGVPLKPGEEHLLADGDLIQIGDVTLRFRRES